jgi:asparagine synthase (glutamine-hydrolysing)
VIEQMTSLMMHEPGYVGGQCTDADQAVAVGWVRHGHASATTLPVWNAARDACLVFVGEHFADRDGSVGNAPEPGDVRQVMDLYERWGPEFVEKLNGCFSGVLIDRRRGFTTVFNDRYGLCRVYYHEAPGAFYFASEAKALLAVVPRRPQLDMRGVAEIVSCGATMQDRSVFARIFILPPGSSWSIAPDGTVKKCRYFDAASLEAQSPLDSASFRANMSDVLRRIMPRYFRPSGDVALSLTGGLDGRIILAWARLEPDTVPCFTFGGTYRDCADVRIARELARHCGQRHETIVADDALLTNFPRLAEQAVYLSDGTMDVTGAVELYVNRVAKALAPIRVTGNYGSEIVRSNVAFKPRALDERFLEPEFARLVQEARETYRVELRGRPLSFIAFKQVPWFHHARFSIEQSQLTVRSPYLDNELIALMYRASPGAERGKDLSLRLVREGNEALARIPTDRGLSDPRVPLLGPLRHAWQEFTVRAEYSCDYGMPQWLAAFDRVLRPVQLEHLFLGRHKFYHFRVWYRDQLAAYLRDILLDRRTTERSYIRASALLRMVEEHTRGVRNHTLDLHRALTFELLQRRLVDA